MTPYDLPTWFLRGAAFVFGLLWGSFLNVVIYRVPREMSVVRPGSHCPGCGRPISPFDNLPLVSFAILGGKARCCGAKMSWRYPAVELIGGLLSLAAMEHVLRMPPAGAEWRFFVVYLAETAFCLGLTAAAFIDWEHMILPDSITLGGAVVGLATAPLRGQPLVDAIASGAVAFGLVWFVFNVLYKKLRGRTGMGMGDAKLLSFAGAWFGWRGAVFVLVAGAIQGTIGSLVWRLVAGKIETPEAVREEIAELRRLAEEGDEEARQALEEDPAAEEHDDFLQAAIPFGPFLILGCLEYLFGGHLVAPLVSRWLLP